MSKTNKELQDALAVMTADRDKLLQRSEDRAKEAKRLPEFEVLVDGGSKMKIVKARINGVYHRLQCVWSPSLKSFISTAKYIPECEEALDHDDMNWFVNQIETRVEGSAPVDTTTDDIPFVIEQ